MTAVIFVRMFVIGGATFATFDMIAGKHDETSRIETCSEFRLRVALPRVCGSA